MKKFSVLMVAFVAMVACSEQPAPVVEVEDPSPIVKESDCFEFKPVKVFGKVSWEQTDDYLDGDLLKKVAFEFVDDGSPKQEGVWYAPQKRKIYVYLITPKQQGFVSAAGDILSIELVNWLDIATYSGRFIGVRDFL